MPTDIVPQTKRCSKCGKEYPKDRENFYALKDGADGLHSWCKECCRAAGRKRKRTPVAELSPDEVEVQRAKGREYYYRNREHQLEYAARPDIRERRNAQRKERYKTPEGKANQRHWAENKRRRKGVLPREEWLNSVRKPKTARVPKQKVLKRDRDLQSLSNDFMRSKRLNAVVRNFTTADWERCLEYFNWCCAACGRQMRDLFGEHVPSADHWIPLSSQDCPGTIPTNVVPLCHGKGGCNNSKGKKRPDDWLAQRFSKHQVREIKERIERYFTWLLENGKTP